MADGYQDRLTKWRNDVEGARFKPREATTDAGLELDVLYTPDQAGDRFIEKIGLPGQYPYTRGIYSTMYRSRYWTMRQYAGFGTAEDTNERFRFLLDQGQTGLSVALDLPSQMGFDSDDERAEGEVGRVGVAIDTLADMEIVFRDIPLDKISTSFTINGTAAIMLAMYLAVAEKQGIPGPKIAGTIQNDILKEYVARGTWIFPPGPAVRLIVDTIEYCMNHAPRFNAISIAGAHFRDAGASAVQELAYTLADAIAYVEATLKRGIDIDDFARQLSFFFYTHNDFFEEAAKYRAGRRLWARIMRDRFNAQDPKSTMFRVGVVCGGSTLTPQQPLNNAIRVAYQAMAAALGGVQSMFTCAWDEPFAIPTEESAELALRTQQILAYETGVADTVDPLGGSYYLEDLTDRMETETEKIINRILDMGGMVYAIENGVIQREIVEEAYRKQRQIESGERKIVGVNCFVKDEEQDHMSLYQPDPEIHRRQLARLRRVRRERSDARVRESLAALREAAEGSENLMPYLIDAVKSYGTVGEITAELKEVFGVFQEPIVV